MTDAYFMKMALKEAEKAFDEDEVPIGAVIVQHQQTIAKGYNMVEKLHDPTAHAEIIALTAACNALGAKYLPDATLYVTVEPCLMCAGAIHWSKIGRIVWGAPDVKNGHQCYTGDKNPFHAKTQVLTGLMHDEASKLMKAFFRGKRF